MDRKEENGRNEDSELAISRRVHLASAKVLHVGTGTVWLVMMGMLPPVGIAAGWVAACCPMRLIGACTRNTAAHEAEASADCIIVHDRKPHIQTIPTVSINQRLDQLKVRDKESKSEAVPVVQGPSGG